LKCLYLGEKYNPDPHFSFIVYEGFAQQLDNLKPTDFLDTVLRYKIREKLFFKQ